MQGSVNLATPDFWNLDWYGDWGQVRTALGNEFAKGLKTIRLASSLSQELEARKLFN